MSQTGQCCSASEKAATMTGKEMSVAEFQWNLIFKMSFPDGAQGLWFVDSCSRSQSAHHPLAYLLLALSSFPKGKRNISSQNVHMSSHPPLISSLVSSMPPHHTHSPSPFTFHLVILNHTELPEYSCYFRLAWNDLPLLPPSVKLNFLQNLLRYQMSKVFLVPHPQL